MKVYLLLEYDSFNRSRVIEVYNDRHAAEVRASQQNNEFSVLIDRKGADHNIRGKEYYSYHVIEKKVKGFKGINIKKPLKNNRKYKRLLLELLDILFDNNKKQIKLWLESYNTHLESRPSALLATNSGYNKVIEYLEMVVRS